MLPAFVALTAGNAAGRSSSKKSSLSYHLYHQLVPSKSSAEIGAAVPEIIRNNQKDRQKAVILMLQTDNPILFICTDVLRQIK